MGTVDPRSITPPAAHGDVIEAGWSIGLAGHRTAEEIPEIVERFQECGITAEILDEVLTDPNRLLLSPDRDGEQWAQQYGGPAGAACSSPSYSPTSRTSTASLPGSAWIWSRAWWPPAPCPPSRTVSESPITTRPD